MAGTLSLTDVVAVAVVIARARRVRQICGNRVKTLLLLRLRLRVLPMLWML